MSYEDEARIIMNQFKKQQELMATGANLNPGMNPTNENSNSPVSPIEQNIMTNIQSGSIPIPASTPDLCPECNTMHPPVPPGQKCPNAPVASQVKDTGLDDTIINKYLVDLRNIVISQMKTNSIKDGIKFFKYAIVELTKALENYNE